MKASFAPVKSGAASSIVQPSASNTPRCFSMVDVTLGSKGRPPMSMLHAIRVPGKSRSKVSLKISPGWVLAAGDRGSGPAMALSMSAASCTVRAMGPCTDRYDHGELFGHVGTLPSDGRKPTMLQKFAGLRREPPISLPSARGTMPHARETAAPPLLPPHVLVRSYGFSVRPKTSLNVWEPAPNSGVFDLPTDIAPALFRRSTIKASWSGM